jgi:predicted transposase YdaD
VKVECLRLLATLRLDPAKSQLISGFVDTYLKLNIQEEQAFQLEVGTLEETEQEGVMQIVTSWMEQGIIEGEQRGRAEGRTEEGRSLVLRLLARRVGTVPASVEAQVQALDLPQIEALGEALLDFVQLSDLTDWLQGNS